MVGGKKKWDKLADKEFCLLQSRLFTPPDIRGDHQRLPSTKKLLCYLRKNGVPIDPFTVNFKRSSRRKTSQANIVDQVHAWAAPVAKKAAMKARHKLPLRGAPAPTGPLRGLFSQASA
jgi:hypothetical protein